MAVVRDDDEPVRGHDHVDHRRRRRPRPPRSRPTTTEAPTTTTTAPADRRGRRVPGRPGPGGRDPDRGGAGRAAPPTPTAPSWRGRPAAARSPSPGTPLTGANVVLDPGHGGDEPGAVGPAGTTEKAVNLAIAQEAKRQLEALGATVVLTRTADYRITLVSRAAIATSLRPQLFVSIHHNAAPDGPRDGPGRRDVLPDRLARVEAGVRAPLRGAGARLHPVRRRVGGRPRRRRQVPARGRTAATTTASSTARPACRRCSPRPPSSATPPEERAARRPRLPGGRGRGHHQRRRPLRHQPRTRAAASSSPTPAPSRPAPAAAPTGCVDPPLG